MARQSNMRLKHSDGNTLHNFWFGAPKWFVNKTVYIIGRFSIIPFSNQKINFFEEFRIIATIRVLLTS